MEDISRRSFLVGAGQVVGAACLVPVLSLEPVILKKTVVRPVESFDWITCDIKLIGINDIEYRTRVGPPNFKPHSFTLTYANDLLDYDDPISGQRFKRVNRFVLPNIDLEIRLDYDSVAKKLMKDFDKRKILTQLALDVGHNQQMVGDFIISEFRISADHI